jgi:hypothetical protein
MGSDQSEPSENNRPPLRADTPHRKVGGFLLPKNFFRSHMEIEARLT